MFGPLNRKEADGYRYGQWAGNPKGVAWNREKCAAAVWRGSGGFIEGQCSRNAGHGVDGIYCKQHAKQREEINDVDG